MNTLVKTQNNDKSCFGRKKKMSFCCNFPLKCLLVFIVFVVMICFNKEILFEIEKIVVCMPKPSIYIAENSLNILKRYDFD